MNEITELLKAWANGDESALDQLVPLVDPELKKIAHKYMRNESRGHILQTTALVHEALMKLLREDVSWESRKHFYAFVAKRMRQVLVDYARKETKAEHIHVADAAIFYEKSKELDLLDQALTKFATTYQRPAKVVEYRYFIGMSIPAVAKILGVAPKTVERDWELARAWLKREMSQ